VHAARMERLDMHTKFSSQQPNERENPTSSRPRQKDNINIHFRKGGFGLD